MTEPCRLQARLPYQGFDPHHAVANDPIAAGVSSDVTADGCRPTCSDVEWKEQAPASAAS